MAKPNQLGSACSEAHGKDQKMFQAGEGFPQPLPVTFACFDETGQLAQLRHADGGLHVGELQVVSGMRVGVLVVVSRRKPAHLAREPLAAGVVGSRFAPAVTAPVAKRFDEGFQKWSAGEDAAAFSRGDVVRGIEAGGSQVPECPCHAAAPGRSQGVTVVLNHPEIMLSRERQHAIEIERISQRVGQHNGPRPRRDGFRHSIRIRVVGSQIGIHKDRHECMLYERKYGGRKCGGCGDHFVARL
jgi:hypothetical protein